MLMAEIAGECLAIDSHLFTDQRTVLDNLPSRPIKIASLRGASIAARRH